MFRYLRNSSKNYSIIRAGGLNSSGRRSDLFIAGAPGDNQIPAMQPAEARQHSFTAVTISIPTLHHVDF